MDNTTNQTPQKDNNIIDLRELFLKYLAKWYWFVLSVVVCVICAFLYISSQNPKYAVKSVVMIRNEEGGASSLSPMAILDLAGLGNSLEISDELHIINSKSIMRQTIQQLDLQTTYRIKDGMRYVEQYPTTSMTVKYADQFTDTMRYVIKMDVVKQKDGYQIKLRDSKKRKGTYKVSSLDQPIETCIGTFSLVENSPLKIGDKMRIVTYPMPIIIELYQAQINAAQIKKGSNIITVSTQSETPRKAIAMINKIIDLYNLDAVIDKNIMASNTGAFIEDRLELITKELTLVEQDVEQYKKDNRLTDLTSEAKLFLTVSSEYQKQMAELETQLNLVDYIQSYVKDEKNRYNLIPANLGISDISLETLVREYNKTLLERMRLLRTTNMENPVIMQLESQLSVVRANIITSINSIKDGLNISRNDVLSKDKQFMDRIKTMPTQERQYIEIKRQQQIKEALYLFLYQKREENALMLASTIQPAKTIDTAEASPTASSPRTMIILLFAIILGGCLPILIIFILDLFNDTFTNKKEFEKLVRVPILGQIFHSKENSIVVIGNNVTTPIAELFRLVRTNMHFMLAGKKNPVILITSSISGEGKSFIGINLAMSLAVMKKKVVLVGLDIRNPVLCKYLNINKSGLLTIYLSDDSYTTQDVIFQSDINPNLDVIPAGPIPPNPGELLISSRLDDLIADLRKQYDYILIDSAPLGMVSDTLLLNRFADMTIYISRAKYTPRAMVDFINELYDQKRLNNMACILNGTEESDKVGYGYGYGHKKK